MTVASYLEVVFNIPVNKKFSYTAPKNCRVEPGYRVVASFGKRKLLGYVVGTATEPPAGVKEIKEIERPVDKRPIFHELLLELAVWLSTMYMCSLGEALAAMLPGGRKEMEPEDYAAEAKLKPGFKPSEQQVEAIERITRTGKGIFYLQGVTGSGKTEVFLQVAMETVRRGRGVIYLVPEISLTHQVVELFYSTFGENIAVLHSRLTPSQRLKEWLRALDGAAKLVIGARSAVFAPVRNLGLIVIDEEHEGSYKSGATPRYHARQVAMHRSNKEKSVLVMGSATPSVEAYHRMREGKLVRLSLTKRLSGGDMPVVEIRDLKRETGPLSRPLIEEIRKTHSEGRQTILFLNRRGFSYYFHCRSCGFEMKCRNCSVSLTYHKVRNRMICHYCGYRTQPVDVCPQCGSIDVGYSGFGTERIEEEMARIFPDLRVKRIDTDAVKKKYLLRSILTDFRNGSIDILLGTQMVAKGLHFPGVKLVGIISADTGLQLPDFRAAERTFNLIVQVAGRAGRSHPDGKVVIQTHRPENETIRLAARGELDEFYRKELKVRQDLNFPPFSRLIRLVFRARSGKKALEAARDFLKPFDGSCDVLGPAECPLEMIAGNHRYHLIFRSRKFSGLHRTVRKILASYAPHPGVHLEVDVDPVSLL